MATQKSVVTASKTACFFWAVLLVTLLRLTVVIRTHDIHINLYKTLFFTITGAIVNRTYGTQKILNVYKAFLWSGCKMATQDKYRSKVVPPVRSTSAAVAEQQQYRAAAYTVVYTGPWRSRQCVPAFFYQTQRQQRQSAIVVHRGGYHVYV